MPSINVSDSITLSEFVSIYPVVLLVSTFDSITLSESTTFYPLVLRASVFDSFTLIDTVVTQANKLLLNVNDSIVLSDSISSYISGTIDNNVGPRRGRVVLNGITFLTDPGVYTPLEWDKRLSKFIVIRNVAWQDFGMFQKDNVIKVSSGGNQGVLDEVAAREFHRMFRVKGGVYTFSDWMGNSYNVIMASYKAFPIKEGPLYEYSMELHVASINTLFREVYTES